MGFLMAVTKDGIDIDDAITGGDPNDFIFHSEYNTFKIVASALFTNLSVNASSVTFEAEHGQDSIPSIYALALFPDGYVVVPNGKPRDESASNVERYWRVEVDDEKVYLTFNRGSASNYTVNARVYIFETPLP